MLYAAILGSGNAAGSVKLLGFARRGAYASNVFFACKKACCAVTKAAAEGWLAFAVATISASAAAAAAY